MLLFAAAPSPPIFVLLIVLGALLLGLILDRVALWAGLRRNKLHDFLATLVITGGGAFVGWEDGGRPGAVLGAAIGFIAGTLATAVVFGALALVWSFLRGPAVKANHGSERNQSQPSFLGGRMKVLIFGALPVLYAGVMAHEVYWLANLGALTAQYKVGFRMADLAGRNKAYESFERYVEEDGWHAKAATWRPVVWFVHPDYHDTVHAMSCHLDMLAGHKPPPEKPSAWGDAPSADALWLMWNRDDFTVRDVYPGTTHRLAIRLCDRRFRLFNDCLDRTLLLSRLPRDLFVRGKKVLKRPPKPPEG